MAIRTTIKENKWWTSDEQGMNKWLTSDEQLVNK